jgi:hypothetical protein
MFSMPLLARARGFPCFFALLLKILEGVCKAQQNFGACFKKCLSFGIGDLGHVLTRMLGSIFQRLTSISASDGVDRSRRTAYDRAFGAS